MGPGTGRSGGWERWWIICGMRCPDLVILRFLQVPMQRARLDNDD